MKWLLSVLCCIGSVAWAMTPTLPHEAALPKSPHVTPVKMSHHQQIAEPLSVQAWCLQSVKAYPKTRTQTLVQQLQKQGYAAYTRVNHPGHIVIGPSVSYQGTVQERQVLQKQFDVATTLVRYNPLTTKVTAHDSHDH